MQKFFSIVTLSIAFIISCKQNRHDHKDNTAAFNYDLTAPDQKFELPESLKEISGIAAENDSVVACIGDELGIVYFYNLPRHAIVRTLNFTEKGDFEDIAIIGETMYVLNSHGIIWAIKKYRDLQPVIESYPLAIEEPFELEGLAEHDRTLFVAAKYYHNKKRDTKGQLPVWQVSTSTMQVQTPLFTLPDFIDDTHGQQLPFHTSALLFDNKNKQWLMLSTHTKVFIRCDAAGKVISQQILTAQEFSQPEGICFTPSGNLLISNEGKEGPPTILLFTPKIEKK